MLGKSVKVTEGSWVNVIEFPDDSLCLMGILDSDQERDYRVIQIRFSREAVKKLIPLMQEWVEK